MFASSSLAPCQNRIYQRWPYWDVSPLVCRLLPVAAERLMRRGNYLATLDMLRTLIQTTMASGLPDRVWTIKEPIEKTECWFCKEWIDSGLPIFPHCIAAASSGTTRAGTSSSHSLAANVPLPNHHLRTRFGP